ncbi:hypothetical protein HAT2_00285 [Candidatus Similichlamydia laticola]|uniref:Uncharacterized protein n=2 Tax=Candidatus Similichlamydia laticola TaxID=2170265 RepID=A0A369KCG9_9BACT|nr:hypothetical protein HAT2_00285 [Candidatus Similichlamydia laticola]
MTIQTVSIPFCTRTKVQSVHLCVVERDAFLSTALQTSSTAQTALNREKNYSERSFLSKEITASLLVFPKGIGVNPIDKTVTNGTLNIVRQSDRFYIGFSPSLDRKTKLQQNNHLIMQFHHHQLDSIADQLERKGVYARTSLLGLASEVVLQQEQDRATFAKLHLMLLFDCKRNNLALLCSKKPIPSISPIPVLYALPNSHLFQKKALQPQLKVKYLLDHKVGTYNLPFKDKSLGIQSVIHQMNLLPNTNSCLLVLPYGCSIGPQQELRGGELFLTNGIPPKLCFLPEEGTKEASRREFYFSSFHRSFLDGLKVMQRFAPVNRPSQLSLHMSTMWTEKQSWGIAGVSFFVLASRKADFLAILCQNGEYGLASTDPLHPESGIFPLSPLSVPTHTDENNQNESKQEPPPKRSRTKDDPCTSAQGMEESFPFFQRQGTPEVRTEEERRALAVDGLLALAKRAISDP